MSGQMFSLGIASEDASPPVTPTGMRQINPAEALARVMYLAYA